MQKQGRQHVLGLVRRRLRHSYEAPTYHFFVGRLFRLFTVFFGPSFHQGLRKSRHGINKSKRINNKSISIVSITAPTHNATFLFFFENDFLLTVMPLVFFSSSVCSVLIVLVRAVGAPAPRQKLAPRFENTYFTCRNR